MFIALELFWIILNGRITLEIVLIGLVVSGLVYFAMCKFMDYSIEKDIAFMKQTPLFMRYISCLIYEIVVANYQTIRILTTSKYVKEPAMVTFEVDLKTTVAKVVLANSITLTPGTITISLEGQMLTVHAIDKDFLDGIEESRFIEILREIENTK